jgi:hypothetical protein
MFSKIHNRFNDRGGKRMIMAAAVCAAGLMVGAGGGALLAQLNNANPVPNTETPTVPCCISEMGCSAPCQNDANGESTEIVPVNSVWTTCPLVLLITPGQNPGPCQPMPPTVCGVEVTWSKANCQGSEIFMPWAEPNCSQSPGC